MLTYVLNTSASVRFTVWANAMLSGGCDPDTAARQIRAGDVGHQVAGLAGQPTAVTLPVALNLLRTAGAGHAHLALPVPGDPVGLAGPPPFNEAAVDAGEAVIVEGAGLGLVPSYVGPAVQWSVHPAAAPAPPAGLGEADRGLRLALISAAEALADLGVANWSPEVADALTDIRAIGSGASDTLAPGYGARAVRTAATARRCLAIVAAALTDDGAVSVADAEARRQAVSELAVAARRALVAACAPPGPR